MRNRASAPNNNALSAMADRNCATRTAIRPRDHKAPDCLESMFDISLNCRIGGLISGSARRGVGRLGTLLQLHVVSLAGPEQRNLVHELNDARHGKLRRA